MSIKVFESMIGQTIKSIHGGAGDEEIIFNSPTHEFILIHNQDCCESVSIEDICGDINDLIGSPLIEAEEVSGETPSGFDDKEYESYTWSFYRFGTAKGSIVVRWFGSSNGCYSETARAYKYQKSEWQLVFEDKLKKNPLYRINRMKIVCGDCGNGKGELLCLRQMIMRHKWDVCSICGYKPTVLFGVEEFVNSRKYNIFDE